MAPLDAPSLDDVLAARERICGIAMRTPLVPLGTDLRPTIHLKLENLQPIGSFKLRGAANAMAVAGAGALANGVVTASAGNMAQGVAWCARKAGVACHVVVPESAPATKIAAVERLGASVIKVPFDTWWQTMIDRAFPGLDGVFIHPFADRGVMAGNGTIGLEVLEDRPDIDAIMVPWGGGGLACGIAAAVRAIKPGIRVYAVELDVATPLTASFARGAAETITPVRTFVDGIGGKSVADEMWPLAQELLAGVVTVSLHEVVAAIKLLVERSRIIAEGAGGAAVAAAMKGIPGATQIAAIVSGGNIDSDRLTVILQGGTP